jgi:hypothetical protein
MLAWRKALNKRRFLLFYFSSLTIWKPPQAD